jgi:hypothetical protein
MIYALLVLICLSLCQNLQNKMIALHIFPTGFSQKIIATTWKNHCNQVFKISLPNRRFGITLCYLISNAFLWKHELLIWKFLLMILVLRIYNNWTLDCTLKYSWVQSQCVQFIIIKNLNLFWDKILLHWKSSSKSVLHSSIHFLEVLNIDFELVGHILPCQLSLCVFSSK